VFPQSTFVVAHEDMPKSHPAVSQGSGVHWGRIARSVRLMLPAVAFVAVLALLVVGSCGWVVGIRVDVWQSARERDRLLHHSDHQVIRAACRDLMTKYAGEHIVGDDARLPDVLRELGTSYVSVSKDIVRVELHGGFDHYGVLAFPEGVEGHGDYKVMEGLWYYTE
jgi:hypothetical protein